MISRQAVRLLSRQQQQQHQQQQTLLRREASTPLVYCSSSTLATTTTTTTTTTRIPSTPSKSTVWTPSTSTIAPRGFTVVSAAAPSMSPSASQARCWFSSSSSSSSSSNSTSGTTSTTNGEEKAEEPTAAASASDDDDDDTAQGQNNMKKEEQLELEIKQLKDQLLRSYAEQENTRNIAKRDVREARQFAIKSFAKSLLEVADNLERALDHSSNGESTATNTTTATATADPAASLQALQQGIEMTHAGLVKALQQHGVEKYCEVPGDKFDPALHNALMQYPDPTKAANVDTVGQVIKAGYTLNQRVLRPAEVGVVVAVKK